MFVKISAPKGALKKESAATGRFVTLDDRELFVNAGSSHTVQVTDQEIIFDLVKIQFHTKDHTATAAKVLRDAMSKGSTYVDINAGIESVLLDSRIS
jgi:hypothetical protein